jgi:hypothetical protein
VTVTFIVQAEQLQRIHHEIGDSVVFGGLCDLVASYYGRENHSISLAALDLSLPRAALPGRFLTLGDFERCTCRLDNTLFSCTILRSQCLSAPDFFCTGGDYAGQVEFGILPLVGRSSNVGGCYTFNSGPPIELNSFGAYREMCLTVDPETESTVSLCSVTIGGEDCSKCEVCASGQSITFSCANVDISGPCPTFVAGLVVSQCIGLNLAPR